MIWGILYFICTVICCGILLYVKNITTIDDPLVILAVMCSLAWPIFLVIAILYELGHCVRLLLTKIIKIK